MTLYQLVADKQYTSKFVLENLIGHILDISREDIILRYDQEIDSDKIDQIKELYRQHQEERKPLEYLLGYVQFDKRRWYVDSRTIIPRPETEYMIEAIREDLGDREDMYSIIDVGSGCGILGLSAFLSAPERVKECRLVDISTDALAVAMINAQRHGLQDEERIHFLHADLLGWIGECQYLAETSIVLTGNLPYIPDETFDTEVEDTVKKWEPRVAFVGGDDGLDLYRRMFEQLHAFPQFEAQVVMYLEMMTRQVDILRQEFGDWYVFDEVKTFHFNIRIVKVGINNNG